jgi:hypothetical protein
MCFNDVCKIVVYNFIIYRVMAYAIMNKRLITYLLTAVLLQHNYCKFLYVEVLHEDKYNPFPGFYHDIKYACKIKLFPFHMHAPAVRDMPVKVDSMRAHVVLKHIKLRCL